MVALDRASINKAFPYVCWAERRTVCRQLARELVAEMFDAAQRGTLEHLEGNLRAWDSTAGIYGQPDAMRDARQSPHLCVGWISPLLWTV
jgi:hypothetical protein